MRLGTPEGARLIDGGLNHVDLHGATHDAAAGHSGGLDSTLLSALALGPAAYAHFVRSKKPVNERASGFTDQVARAKTASVVGKAALVAVPFWPVAFLAAAGISMAASVGNNKREQLHRLEDLYKQVSDATREQHQKLERLKRPLAVATR